MTNRVLSIKHGVRLEHLTPQAAIAVSVTASILAHFNYDFTLTSVSDGTHMKGSLHYAGRAFDFRTKNILDSQLPEVFAALREALGPEFDVVPERDHCHVEWDPSYLKGQRAT